MFFYIYVRFSDFHLKSATKKPPKLQNTTLIKYTNATTSFIHILEITV